MLGLQPVVWVGLNEEGRRSLRSALRRPFMVEAGEVVVDPDGGGVAQPGVDVVALPQVAVGVAGGDLRTREIDVRQGWKAEERADEGGGVLAPAGAPDRVTRPVRITSMSMGPWAGSSQTVTGLSALRPVGTTSWRAWVAGVEPSALGKGMRTPSMLRSR
ncbi:hypothetical protein AN221_41895 [Streptomyces nanshensis]|uniref:Uncharacterized protein n=1 Tax=Streptomyces nanshensis TaxID=518642 RepID=A0A1E7LE49_9ACTN|nr:hypothetical protein AN221_41895 [Streptomyces nanshensis]